MEIKIERNIYNRNASQWMSNLIAGNYGLDVDFSQYELLDDSWEEEKLLKPNSPEDYYRSIIFLINGYTEYGQKEKDSYGRLPYKASFQYENDIYDQNLVQRLIEKLLGFEGHQIEDRPSRMIVSHDIDTLHHGGIYELVRGLKTMNIGLVYRVLVAGFTKKPIWFNLELILDLLDKYGVKSVFYFLVEEGRSADGIKNADYQMTEPRVRDLLNKIKEHGSEIGLHKSSLDSDYDKQINCLPVGSVSNRNHFLRYRLPNLFRDLANSSLQTDTSFCFPYNMGFRNNYGLPFEPFDLEYGVKLDILMIPFQIMDGMFPTVKQSDADKSFKDIKSFLDAHKQNCVLGMLWHNTELSEVAHPNSYSNFEKILIYLNEQGIDTQTPSQIRAMYMENKSILINSFR